MSNQGGSVLGLAAVGFGITVQIGKVALQLIGSCRANQHTWEESSHTRRAYSCKCQGCTQGTVGATWDRDTVRRVPEDVNPFWQFGHHYPDAVTQCQTQRKEPPTVIIIIAKLIPLEPEQHIMFAG